MQVSSIMTDLITFKDEIFKKVRLLENKLVTEVNSKYSEMFTNYEKLDNRLSFLSENNDSLLELVTSQKVDLDKVKDLETFKNKAEHNMMMHDIKIKSVASELDKIKSKYDRALSENLQVPGYVGPGCQFKTISEYITNNIFEFSKLKNDRDQMKIENVEIRNRLDNILKSTINLVDSSILRCQKYSDTKHQDMQNILNNKLIEISEKNMDIRTYISKTELNNEKQIESLKTDVEKLLLMKNELIALTDKKIEEINNKIEEMTKEIHLVKSQKRERTIIEKENDKSNSKPDYSKINNNENINKNINININYNRKNNYKLQKNPVIINNQNSNSNISNNANNVNNVNNMINIKNQLNNSNTNLDETKTNKIKYNQDLKKQIPNKEEKFLNLYKKDYSTPSFDKNNNPTNLNNNNDYLESSKEKIKEDNKKIEGFSSNNIENDYKSSNFIQDIKDERIIKDFNSPNIVHSTKNEEINKINNNNNINNSYKNLDLKNTTSFFNNKKKINTTKIRIESLEKRKYAPLNSSSLNSNELRNKKEESEHDQQMEPELEDQVQEQDQQQEQEQYQEQDQTLENEYNLKSIMNKNIKNNMEEKIKFLPKKEYSNINIINVDNKDDDNFCITPKGYHTIDKNERRHIIEYNEEQSEIMNKIKTFYNNKKEKNEQKSLENIVDCNIINLNLQKNSNNRNKRSSAKNNLRFSKEQKASKVNKLRYNLSEIGMKITPAFGRTTYSFYNKNNFNINSYNIGIQNNKKINSLKDRLNMALVSSIREKIGLNDKGINVK